MFLKCTVTALISAFSVMSLTVYLTPGLFNKMVVYAISDIEKYGLFMLLLAMLLVLFRRRFIRE